MLVAPQVVVTTRSSNQTAHVESTVIDARPLAMHGALIAMILVFPFWVTVAAVVVRLASGH